MVDGCHIEFVYNIVICKFAHVHVEHNFVITHTQPHNVKNMSKISRHIFDGLKSKSEVNSVCEVCDIGFWFLSHIFLWK